MNTTVVLILTFANVIILFANVATLATTLKEMKAFMKWMKEERQRPVRIPADWGNA